MSEETLGLLLTVLVFSPGILTALYGQWVYRKRIFFGFLSLWSPMLGMIIGMVLTFSLIPVTASGPWFVIVLTSSQLLCASLSWWLVRRFVDWYDNTMAEYHRAKEHADTLNTPTSR